MPLELPEMFDIDWNNYQSKLNELYQIYLDDIYKKLHFLEEPVFCREDPLFDGKHECFWHLMTQDYEKRKENSGRFPDMQRCKRIKWIKFFIENYNNSAIKFWKKVQTKKKGRKSYKEIRYYIWSEEHNFVVILGKQNRPIGHQLITSYCTNQEKTKIKFIKEYNDFTGLK